MIIKNNPSSRTLTPVSLKEIFTKKTKDIYTIETSFQRPYVWGCKEIDDLFDDIQKVVEENYYNSSDSDKEEYEWNEAWANMGSLDYSNIDDRNKKYFNGFNIDGNIKSIVDASQRTRTFLCIYLSLLMFKTIQKKTEDEKINIDCMILNSGLKKIVDTDGKEFKKLFEIIDNKTVLDIIENRKSSNELEKLFNDNGKENKEKDIVDLFYFCTYRTEELLENIKDISIDYIISIFLNNIYFCAEFIDDKYKFERFIDRNDKGTPMSIRDLAPKFIINFFDEEYRDSLLKKYNEFNEISKKCDKEGLFKSSSKVDSCAEFVMIEVLKIVLGKEKIKQPFKSTFNLKDFNYGIENCCNRGFYFKTPEQAEEYFDLCIEMANFIYTDSMAKHENSVDDFYYFIGFKGKPSMWWYCIKPTFILHKYYSGDIKENVKDLMLKAYFFMGFVKPAIGTTNTQAVINLYEDISYSMLLHLIDNKDYELKNSVSVLVKDFMKNYMGSLTWNDIVSLVRNLNYQNKNHKKAIEKLFMAFEYNLIKKFNLDDNKFYKFYINQEKWELDHWLPQNKLGDDTSMIDEGNRIGNIVLLEKRLNDSKQDNTEKNDNAYLQSDFFTTKLLNNTYRPMYAEDMDKINRYEYVLRYSPDELNNPTKEMLEYRKVILSNFVESFMREYFR